MADGCTAHADAQRPGGLELTDRAIGLCGLPAGARVLDVGCGAGAAVRYLKKMGYDASGIDPQAAGPHCLKGRAESLPFEDATFACALSECALSVVDDPGLALQEMHRVLAPGGYAAISDVYDKSRPRELAELLARCGFTVCVFQDHSRCLREFAAAAALQGKSCAEILPGHIRPERAGYFLLIARKD